MHIELAAPACLFLGIGLLDGELCQIGIALRHPPVHMVARTAVALSVTGGRADLAAGQAARFYQHYRHELPRSPGSGGEGLGAEIEIELAVPSLMGLGSSAILGLSVAHALAALHNRAADNAAALARAVDLSTDEALETHAFAQGGLLAVGSDGRVVRRQAIAHHDEEKDWVFVFVLPRLPAGTPETLELDRRHALRARIERHAASDWNANALLAAAGRDDLAAFARALAALHEQNEAALAATRASIPITSGERAILDVMRAGGAIACGRALAGLALYGLVRGAEASRELRRALQQHLGFFGGTVMATICDNQGARFKESAD
jgi:predicted sugar kinase